MDLLAQEGNHPLQEGNLKGKGLAPSNPHGIEFLNDPNNLYKARYETLVTKAFDVSQVF